MEQTSRFVFQENQFNGECLPCTAAVFNKLVDSSEVAQKISTRQAVEQAISSGEPLDSFVQSARYQSFCQREGNKADTGSRFLLLTEEQKLQQWVASLKMWLPCFIFGVSSFEAVPKTDKKGNVIVDADGKPVLFRRRKLEGIEQLSGLFMFDADHLPMDPKEVFLRTQLDGFPFELRLAHKTSSGHGLRLVCEARSELGNIADNQIELARELGLLGVIGTTGSPVADDSCIDASRISYCPRREDIYFIDNDKLFNC